MATPWGAPYSLTLAFSLPSFGFPLSFARP